MTTPEESGRRAASRFGLRPTRLAAQRVKKTYTTSRDINLQREQTSAGRS